MALSKESGGPPSSGSSSSLSAHSPGSASMSAPPRLALAHCFPSGFGPSSSASVRGGPGGGGSPERGRREPRRGSGRKRAVGEACPARDVTLAAAPGLPCAGHARPGEPRPPARARPVGPGACAGRCRPGSPRGPVRVAHAPRVPVPTLSWPPRCFRFMGLPAKTRPPGTLGISGWTVKHCFCWVLHLRPRLL